MQAAMPTTPGAQFVPQAAIYAEKVGLSPLFPTGLQPSAQGKKCLQAPHGPKVLQKDAVTQKT